MKWMRLACVGVMPTLLLASVAFAAGPIVDEDMAGDKAYDVKSGGSTWTVDGLGCDCCLGEPWTLFGTTCSGVQAGGWAQIGYHTEGANGFGTGMFNNHPNNLDLQQAWIFLGKQTDTTCQTWDWGFRMDYVYGTDGQDTQAFGGRPDDWDNDWNSGGFYGHAIPQLYGEIAYNDLLVRVGHFDTIVGYEVVQAPQNFFYSHAYTMVQAEPFSHTGIMTELAWNENVTLYNGWTAGWDTGFSSNGGSTYVGGFGLQLTDNASLTYTTTIGDFGFGTGGSDSLGYSHSLVWDWQINDQWEYVLQSDYVDNQIFVDRLAGASTNGHIVSCNNYLFYTINDCWKLGTRLEWFKVDTSEVVECTFGANYRPNANVVIRPEIRVDDFDSGVAFRDSTTFGLDAIVTF